MSPTVRNATASASFMVNHRIRPLERDPMLFERSQRRHGMPAADCQSRGLLTTSQADAIVDQGRRRSFLASRASDGLLLTRSGRLMAGRTPTPAQSPRGSGRTSLTELPP
jgi:hypothetical protein